MTHTMHVKHPLRAFMRLLFPTRVSAPYGKDKQGVIYDMDISPANIHDIRYLSDLKNSLTNCVLVGDKGYLSVSEQVDLFTHYNVRLEVPYRCNQLN